MNQKQNQKKIESNLETEKLKKELEELKKQVEDYKNKYFRALADYQNYENRAREEKDQVNQTAIKNVLLKILPFLDNLEKAEMFVKDDGLKMVKDNFYKALQELGLEEIQILGKSFDPYTAEAVDTVEGKEDNIVKEVLRKGYRHKDKLLRAAQVIVSKKVKN